MRKILSKSQAAQDTHEKSGIEPSGNVLLKNCTIIHQQFDEEKKFDIHIANGKIKQINPGEIDALKFEGKVIDVNGKLVLPGLFDLHVHFREPGREDEETLISGARAAMSGGFTAVSTMPNTNPVTDNREIIEFIFDRMKDQLVSVFPIAAITRGQKGKDLVEMAELAEAGVVAFSDDGKSVANALTLRRALEYARMFDVPIIEHCEEPDLAADGVMHEGFVSSDLGLSGIPAIAEDVIVARDILLAEYTKSKLHIAHISTAGAVELVRRAKEKGVKITAEATPHHFTLTDEEIRSFDSNFKMNPPLRSREHVQAVIDGLKDGTIDAIATDHAPHSIEEKDAEFAAAPFGIIGLETAIGLTIKQLIQPGILSWQQAVEKLSTNPYKILGLEIPEIKENKTANLTIIDPETEWTVNKNELKSRSKNTPFQEWVLPGKISFVFNNGYYFSNDR